MYKISIALVGVLAGCVAEEDTASTISEIDEDACPAGVPADLAPAENQDLAFTLFATGTQNYTCNAAGTGWTFIAPVADLFRGDHEHVHGTHYAGPTWEWEDGSTVAAARVSGATIDASAIPWLLLRVVGHGPIPGKMSEVTNIQRLLTTEGLAPAGACTPGAALEVPYTATYFFYRTKQDNTAGNTRCGA